MKALRKQATAKGKPTQAARCQARPGRQGSAGMVHGETIGKPMRGYIGPVFKLSPGDRAQVLALAERLFFTGGVLLRASVNGRLSNKSLHGFSGVRAWIDAIENPAKALFESLNQCQWPAASILRGRRAGSTPAAKPRRQTNPALRPKA